MKNSSNALVALSRGTQFAFMNTDKENVLSLELLVGSWQSLSNGGKIKSIFSRINIVKITSLEIVSRIHVKENRIRKKPEVQFFS
jgi:hypothetical protein